MILKSCYNPFTAKDNLSHLLSHTTTTQNKVTIQKVCPIHLLYKHRAAKDN